MIRYTPAALVEIQQIHAARTLKKSDDVKGRLQMLWIRLELDSFRVVSEKVSTDREKK